MTANYNFQELYESGTLTDVILMTSDGRQFSAHKVILAVESGYFRAQFTTGDSMTPRTEVDLQGIPGESMSILLDYMYSRRLAITKDNILTIIAAADYLVIDNALNLCIEFLESHFTNEDCLELLTFTRKYDIRPSIAELTESIWKYVLKNFEAISKTEEFLRMDITDLANLFKSDRLNVPCEETVWRALVAWYEHDPEERSTQLFEAVKNIRFGLMTTQFLLENVRDYQAIADNPECRPYIVHALRYFFDMDLDMAASLPLRAMGLVNPRYPSELLFAVGGWSGGCPTSCIEVYDVRADRWTMMVESDPEGPRAYHGTVVDGTDIYVIGGYNGHHYFSSCRCFDLKTRTWRDLPSLNNRRCYVSVAMVGTYIYAMGGYDGVSRLSTVERLNIRGGVTWTQLQPMYRKRSDADAAVIDGKIYITGGFTGQECLNCVEEYDPQNNEWRFLPPMESKRSGVSCVSFQDCLYVLGGFDGSARLSTVEKFNPKTNRWYAATPMLHARSNFAVTCIEGCLMVIGGFNGEAVTSDVESYNPITGMWSEVRSLNVQRSALTACTVSDVPDLEHFIYRPQIRALVYPEQEDPDEQSTIHEDVPLINDVPRENAAARRSRMFFSVRHG